MGYHRVRGFRVGLVGRDGHEMDLDLTLREKATSEEREVRNERSYWVEEKGLTLKRIQSSLGWGR